jgi:hypothetical protein
MPDKIEQTKLCRVPHDYLLFEPYCHLTPDGKGVVFNTIYQNQKVVCIVEVPEKLQVLMMKDESILEN